MTMKNACGWNSIKNNRPTSYGRAAIERWLRSDGVVSFTANTLNLLNFSLLYVLDKVVHAAGIVTTGSFAAQFTLLDRLAMILEKAAKISVEVSVWVYHLVKKMAALIGITVKKGANLTVEFIRTVFIHLHNKISEMVSRVGRAVG